MANHPVRLIELYCQKLISERRSKIKVPQVSIPRNLYWDDTPDPPSGLSIEKGHVFRPNNERLCHPADRFVIESDEDDAKNGFMFDPEEYETVRFENPLIKQLRECQTVEEMYALADEIIGTLKTLGDEGPTPVSPAA